MQLTQTLAPASLHLAALLTSLAALAHFACIFLGAPAFRFLGAGEPLAQMAERGHWYPPLVAFAIGALLAVWAAYAASAAGLVTALPFTKYVLPLVASAFLLRALLFPLLKPAFPDNSTLFWLTTSGICLVIGLSYAVGAVAEWHKE